MSGQENPATILIIVGKGGRGIAEILERDRVLFNKMLGMAKMEGESATLRPCHLKTFTPGPSEVYAVGCPDFNLSDTDPVVIGMIEDDVVDVNLSELLSSWKTPPVYVEEQKSDKSYEKFLPKTIGRQKRRK